MMRPIPNLLTLAALLVALTSCRKPEEPPTPFPTGARERLIVQRQFRLGNLDFGGEDPLTDAIPAMILTELAASGRFSIYEGGGIRGHEGTAITEETAKKYTDGYLSGTITSKTSSEVCVDVRLSNSFNHEVLFTKLTCLALETNPEGKEIMRPDREAAKRLAEEIARTVKEVGNAKVVSADGKLLFIDIKAETGILPGMVGYIVATGSSHDDDTIHRMVLGQTGVDPSQLVGAGSPIIVGEVAVVQVEEDYTVAQLYNGDYALPGDTVFFK